MKKIIIIDLIKSFERDNLLKQLSVCTIKYYAEFLGHFLQWLPPRIKYAHQLTQTLFDDYALYVIHHIPNRISQNTYLRAVRRLFNYGAEKAFCTAYKLQLPKTFEPIKPTFSDTDIAKIVNNKSNCKGAVMAVLLLATGIRSATLRALQVVDFNLIESSLILRHLKNGKQAILPLPLLIAKRLKLYIGASNLQSESLLFPNSKGGKYTANGLNHYINKYCDKLGLSGRGVHIFRHTFAKCMAKEGCPSITLARCLTHSTIQQSQRYVNLYGNDLRQACERYNPLNAFENEKEKTP